jgi:hypothetical protein
MINEFIRPILCRVSIEVMIHLLRTQWSFATLGSLNSRTVNSPRAIGLFHPTLSLLSLTLAAKLRKMQSKRIQILFVRHMLNALHWLPPS